MNELAQTWGGIFGLAVSPLFEERENSNPDRHAVLLDGGAGSFILTSEEVGSDWAASWAWSSGLPNHVAVEAEAVTVTGWDTRAVETFSRSSVEQKLPEFYDYLQKRKPTRVRDVVTTLTGLFRSIRGELSNSGEQDSHAIPEFLSILAELSAQEATHSLAAQTLQSTWSRVNSALHAEPVLDSGRRAKLEAGFRSEISSVFGINLLTSLSIRHAASAIFQEAHFAFESSSQLDLFGHQPQSATRSPVTRGAHHFTPASLARSIVEQALAAVPRLGERETLTILDPACGSGAFLTEALRALRRLDFRGSIRIVGRDTSKAAILMAHFALIAAKLDWQPFAGSVELDIREADSLEEGALPACDVVLMNPPFLAWSMMSAEQRERVSAILGSNSRQRPDIAMAFITACLGALPKGGVVASLIPASLLNSESGLDWRKDLLDRARLRFLGSFGDYGLFTHALVQIAALVLVVGEQGMQDDGLAVQVANDDKATSAALRSLRLLQGRPSTEIAGLGWRLTPMRQEQLKQANRWRILSADVEIALRHIDELGNPTVADLFEVKQGLLTGLNRVFVLTSDDFQILPEREKQFFRPAVYRDAIKQGRVSTKYYVFYPYSPQGGLPANEQEVEIMVPTFYAERLAPNKTALSKRSGIDNAKRPWWALSRFYSWAQRTEPRIVSKYFGGLGSFVLDEDANLVILQGYAWFARSWLSTIHPTGLDGVQTMHSYTSLLNTKTFNRLVGVYSDDVSGGQFNLSSRFVNSIPLPDLTNSSNAEVAHELYQLALRPDYLSSSWLQAGEQIASRAWGNQLVEALRADPDA